MSAFDRAWRDKLLAADPDAAIQLANQGLGPVWEFCRQHFGADISQMRDVTRTVLVKAVQQIAQYDPDISGGIVPWVLGIAEGETRRVGNVSSGAETINGGEATAASSSGPDQRFLYQIQADLCLVAQGLILDKAREQPVAPSKSSRYSIPCPQCGQCYQVDASRIGRKVRCSACNATFACESVSRPTNASHDVDPAELWYINGDSGERGPYTAAQIRELISTGQVPHDTRVRRGSSGTWMSALGLFSRALGSSELLPSVLAPPTALLRSPIPPPLPRPTASSASSVPPPVSPTCPKSLGRFQVRHRVGGGSFGAVYRAYDPVLDREVALKVAHASVWEDKRSRELITAEPKAAAKLRHPNIVAVHDAGSHEEQFFVALEFISGQTLKQRLAHGPIDQQAAVNIVRDVARALDYAHRTGVVHRDVKPANIMLDDQGHVLLTDFGLAQLEHAIGHQHQEQGCVGTPGYMPPEQVSPKWGDIGPASDQYSLGVVLYELLCHQTPFSGPPELQCLNTLQTEPPSPRTIDPLIPKELEAICQKAMAKQIAARYESVGQVADDLSRYSEGRETVAHPWGISERIYNWCAASPALASAVAASMFLLLLFAITLGVTAKTERTLREKAEDAQGAAEEEKGKAEKLKGKAEDAALAAKESEEAAQRARGVAEKLLEETNRAKLEVSRGQAITLLRQGQQLCATGELPQGLAMMVESLKYAEVAAKDYIPAIQMNLDAWWKQLHPLRAVAPHPVETPLQQFAPHLAAVSPNGDFAVTARWIAAKNESVVCVWSLSQHGGIPLLVGRPIYTTSVQTLSFNSSGSKFATIQREKGGGCSAFVWHRDGDGYERELRSRLTTKDEFECLAFANDDTTLFVGGGNDRGGFIQGANWESHPQFGKVVFPHPVRRLAFAHVRGREALIVASGTGQRDDLLVYDFSEEDVLWARSLPKVYDFAVTPDGRRVVTAVGGRFEGEVQQWDLSTGQRVGPPLRHLSTVYSVDVIGDKLLTGCQDGFVRVWHAETGRMIGHKLVHRGEVRSVQAIPHPNGASSEFLSASDDGALRVWSLGVGLNTEAARFSSGVADGAYQHGRGLLTIVNSSSQELISIRTDDLSSHDIAFSIPLERTPSAIGWAGKHCLVGFESGHVDAVHLESGYAMSVGSQHNGSVKCISVDVRKGMAATGGTDGQLQLWTLEPTPAIRTKIRNVGTVETAAFDPLTPALVSGGNGGLYIWDLEGRPYSWFFDGLLLEKVEMSDVLLNASFSEDGRFLALGYGSGGQVWKRANPAGRTDDLASWTLHCQFELEFGVTQLEILATRDLMVSGDAGGSVRYWNLATGEPVGPALRHASAITMLAINRQEMNLLAGTVEGHVQRWPLPVHDVGVYDEFRRKLWSEAGVVYHSETIRPIPPAAWTALAPGERSPAARMDAQAAMWPVPRDGESKRDFSFVMDLIRTLLTETPEFHPLTPEVLERHMPTDTYGAIGLDVRQFLTAPLLRQFVLATDLFQRANSIDIWEQANGVWAWLEMAEFNPLRDLNYLVWTFGTIPNNLTPSNGTEMPVMLAVHGRFDTDQIMAALRDARVGPTLDYLDMSYSVIREGRNLKIPIVVLNHKSSKAALYIAVVENRTLLISLRKDVVENVLNRPASVPINADFKALLDKVDKRQTLWLASDLHGLMPAQTTAPYGVRFNAGDYLQGGITIFSNLDAEIESNHQILGMLNYILPSLKNAGGFEFKWRFDPKRPRITTLDLHVPAMYFREQIMANFKMNAP